MLQMRCLHVTGRTTGEINFDASAGEVESKLEALANVGDVSVTEASTDSDTTQASAPCPPPSSSPRTHSYNHHRPPCRSFVPAQMPVTAHKVPVSTLPLPCVVRCRFEARRGRSPSSRTRLRVTSPTTTRPGTAPHGEPTSVTCPLLVCTRFLSTQTGKDGVLLLARSALGSGVCKNA